MTDVQAAVAAAWSVRRELAASPAHLRAAALDHVSRTLEARRDEVSALITEEMGKPARWADVEVTRAVSTFRFGAGGGAPLVGLLAAARHRPRGRGTARRRPPGAARPRAGDRAVQLPPEPGGPQGRTRPRGRCADRGEARTRGTSHGSLLESVLAETDLPAGAVSVLAVDNETTQALVRDPRLPVVSFTGSVPVGWAIRDAAPRKHVVLELGGNAAVVVCEDADLARAAERTALFSMYQGGQSCIAVQRVYVLAPVFEEFRSLLLAAVSSLSLTDDVGPLVNDEAAARVEAWVTEAVADGATVLCGGTRDGRLYPPTVLADVPAGAKVLDDEVFGPVVVLVPVSSLDEAFAAVNDSRFGLQAGVFTRDVQVAFRAFRELEVGGVVIGDVPSYRADQMPYGGMKDSGTGREGVRAAMHDLTEEKVMVLTGLDL